jgi:hypothetical protein
MVGAKNLSQEHPERHKWRVDAVVPTDPNRLKRLGEAIRREDLGEGKRTFLQELTSYKSDLLTKSSLTGNSHLTGLLAYDGRSIATINVGKPGIAYPYFSKEVLENYVPFVDPTEARKDPGHGHVVGAPSYKRSEPFHGA